MLTEESAGMNSITDVLENSRFGLSISEISRRSGMNRNSVAKYLGILQTLGLVEKEVVGPARVYHLSQKIPVSSSAINRLPDPIISLHNDGTIRDVNESFEEYYSLKKSDCIGKSLESISVKLLQKISGTTGYHNALTTGTMNQTNIWKSFTGENEYFWLSAATFEDGSSGVVIALRSRLPQKCELL